jgi:hypothetical protein
MREIAVVWRLGEDARQGRCLAYLVLAQEAVLGEMVLQIARETEL